jgi:hypothetical protein
MENDKFDRETMDKYLEILVKKYPNQEHAVACAEQG